MLKDKLKAEFTGAPPLHQMAHYHLNTNGKCLRGQLALSEAAVLGVNQEKAMLWALACELLHNATLIHDDIQDNDPIRRGQESLWKKYGVAHAINAGDLLIFRAFKLTSQLGNSKLTELLATTSESLVRGQSEELIQISSSKNGFWKSYLEMTRLKTGALFQMPVLGAHILAGEDKSFTQTNAWLNLGACYQINDDIRDYLGLKQKGQFCKDFEEKRINAIVAWLSNNPTHENLINDYLNIPFGTIEHQSVMRNINTIVDDEDILINLQIFAQTQLEDFKKKTTQTTQNVILNFLESAIPMGKFQNESRP